MAEIKRNIDVSQSEAEIPYRYTKTGLKQAELNNGVIVKEGVAMNPKVFKTLQTVQRFYDTNGLADINLDFSDCTGKYFEFEYMCENNTIKSAFNDNTNDTPLASFIIKSDNINGEKWINYKPYDCNSVSGSASGNMITYTGVYTDTNIEYKNLVNTIKQYIKLTSSSAPSVFDFTIKTSKGISLIVGELPVLKIQYTGSSDVGTIEVTSNNHIIGKTQSTTAFDLDLTSASYDTLTEVAAHIDNLSTWTANLIGSCGSCRSKTLSVLAETDCKTNAKDLDAALKNVTAVNTDMSNSRTYWKIKRPVAESNRTGADLHYGFVDVIPASEHINGTYDVVRVTVDSSWVSSEFSGGATEVVIDPTTYRTIRDYGNITFCGDYADGNQHGINGFMNGYGLINRATEGVQTGGTRCDKDNNVNNLTFVDPDGTETTGAAATCGVWTYSSPYWYTNKPGAKIKYIATSQSEVWARFYVGTDRGVVKTIVVDNAEHTNYIDLYNGSNTTDQKILLSTSLIQGSLQVEIEVTNTKNISSTDNYVYFYGFESYAGANQLASKDAITINSRATYGLDCTYAKHPLGIQYDARGNLANDTGGDPAKGSFSAVGKMGFAYDADANKHWIMGKEADTEVAGDKRLYYDGSDDKFHFAVYNGADWTTVDAQSAVQTFSANDVIHIACTWDETSGAQLFIDNVKTSDSSTWTAVDLAGNVVIGNDPVSPSATEQADMIIAEPTVFDYVLTDEEVYDIYTSTKPIWEMDFGRRIEVLNAINNGMLFNYSGVIGADHRIGSFAGNLYDTSVPTGTAIAESAVTFSGTWTDSGNYRYTTDKTAYMLDTTPVCTEIWACFYAGTDRGIAEYIIDEGTSKEKHVLIDQYHSGSEDRYALVATGLESTTHTIKIKMKNLKNISSTGKGIYVGLNSSADKMYYYTTSGSENISSDSLTVNNRLIDNVLNCNYTDMPKAITFPDKGNISEYDMEGTVECWVNTSWVGNDGNTHYIFQTRDSSGNNGMSLYTTSNVLAIYFLSAATNIGINGAINGTNWAAGTHHILMKWWRPTSSTMGMALYLDGVKLAENKSQSFTPSVHSEFMIGNILVALGSSYDFEGEIYDLSVHNHAFDDGGVAVSASASAGSEVYNSYHSIARKYKEDLSDQVDGVKTTFYLSRGVVLKESDALAYDDGEDASISSFKEGTWCRTNGAISASDTTIVVDSHTVAESEIDTNGGYLWIGPANSLWRKKVEYSSYVAGTNTFTVANSGTVGEDFVDNTIIEVCGTVTLTSAPALASKLEITYYYSGDSVDIEYGLVPDRLNKNLFLDVTENSTTGWDYQVNTLWTGHSRVITGVKGQVNILNFDKNNLNLSSQLGNSLRIIQCIINQGTKDEKSILLDQYGSSTVTQVPVSLGNGLPNQSILRMINGVDVNSSSTDDYNIYGSHVISSQYDLTKDALISNDINCVFDFSAIRVVDGQVVTDLDKSGNLLLAEDLDDSETDISFDTDTAADMDKLGRPYGIVKVDNERIYYSELEIVTSTSGILHNCKRGYMADLTGGVATTHTNNAAIQLVGAWRNNVNAMNQSWYSSDGAFPYRALLIGCGTEGVVEGGLVIRDLDQDKNYKVCEADDTNAIRGAVKCIKAHTGKIEVGFGSLNKGMTDLDFINNEILGHGTAVGYGSAAGTKGTISEVNDGLGWSYTTNTGVALNSSYVNDIAIDFDAINYNIWVTTGESGTTGSSAGINRIYDGGDGILDTEYDLDADTSYWATELCYDIANDDLYVSQTNGTADQEIVSKIGTPKISADSTIDTADGTDRLTSQPITNDITIENSNVWFAGASGAKKIVKASFSGGVTDTLDSSDFAELSIDNCEAIAYDPDRSKLLLGFNNNSTDGLLIECDTDGSSPEYYDKTSETDADRNNVLAGDQISAVTYFHQEAIEVDPSYTLSYAGFVAGSNVGLTIKEPEGVSYSTHVDIEIVKTGNQYTRTIVGTGNRREILISKNSNIYTRTLDEDPHTPPMVDKIITKNNNQYTSTDP